MASVDACVHMLACPGLAQKHECLQLLGQAESLCSNLTDHWSHIAIEQCCKILMQNALLRQSTA